MIDLSSCLSSAGFWLPDNLQRSAWLRHAPFAFWLVETIKPQLIVELGTHRGFSYCVFCQAVDRLDLKTSCYAVDTWQGDVHAGYYGDDVFAALRSYHDSRYSTFSQLLRSTFDEALSKFSDGTIDLLHIDGRHFYEDVKHDFESWLPKLSPKGVVLIHDTHERGRGFGVYKYWEELKSRYPYFEFAHGHGLGVLGVGPANDQLKDLFAASNDPALSQSINDAYNRLGSGVADKLAIMCLTDRLKRHAKRIADQSRRADVLQRKLDRAESRLAAVHGSTSWWITRPLRASIEGASRARSAFGFWKARPKTAK